MWRSSYSAQLLWRSSCNARLLGTSCCCASRLPRRQHLHVSDSVACCALGSQSRGVGVPLCKLRTSHPLYPCRCRHCCSETWGHKVSQRFLCAEVGGQLDGLTMGRGPMPMDPLCLHTPDYPIFAAWRSSNIWRGDSMRRSSCSARLLSTTSGHRRGGYSSKVACGSNIVQGNSGI